MKLFDNVTQVTTVSDLVLGQEGRGRNQEEVRLDGRTPPQSPDRYGVRSFTVGERTHAVFVDSADRGILVRINTYGTYTKGSSGSCRGYGACRPVISGSWAVGSAGRCGDGPDTLFEVTGQSVITAVISGGDHKGYGLRVFVSDGSRLQRFRLEELAACLVSDDAPWVTAVCRACVDSIEAGGSTRTAACIRDSLAAAAVLEDSTETEQTAETIQHYLSQGLTLESLPFGLRPAPGAVAFGGVGPGNVLMPGQQQLVAIEFGGGGGKRHRVDNVQVSGLNVLQREDERAFVRLVALVDSPDWSVSYDHLLDGAVEYSGSFSSAGEDCWGETRPW